MRVSLLILPIYDWTQARSIWRTAERMGFDAAYTYDHLSWRSFRGTPWFGAVSTLAAAAAVTTSLRLGLLVTSPNLRHPVVLAKELISIDNISGGRLDIGVGAGAEGYDASVLNGRPWGRTERADRFEEFVRLLDLLLRQEVTTFHGRYYSAHEANMAPGCVQRPRAPLMVAATGTRGMHLAAAVGDAWVTYGRAKSATDSASAVSIPVLRNQLSLLTDACRQQGRDVTELDRVYLVPAPAQALSSVEAFIALATRCAQAGITQLVFHYPVPGTVLDADLRVFESLSEHALPLVRTL